MNESTEEVSFSEEVFKGLKKLTVMKEYSFWY
jgi:hypothetical protein